MPSAGYMRDLWVATRRLSKDRYVCLEHKSAADGRVDSSAGEPTKNKVFIKERAMYQEISFGDYYNIPIKVFYIESDADAANIPDSAPAGSICLVNESNNFHCLMKQLSGNWNAM